MAKLNEAELQRRLRRIAAALEEIGEQSTGHGLFQPGAAWAAGTLAEAVEVEPGDRWEEMAERLMGLR